MTIQIINNSHKYNEMSHPFMQSHPPMTGRSITRLLIISLHYSPWNPSNEKPCLLRPSIYLKNALKFLWFMIPCRKPSPFTKSDILIYKRGNHSYTFNLIIQIFFNLCNRHSIRDFSVEQSWTPVVLTRSKLIRDSTIRLRSPHIMEYLKMPFRPWFILSILEDFSVTSKGSFSIPFNFFSKKQSSPQNCWPDLIIFSDTSPPNLGNFPIIR